MLAVMVGCGLFWGALGRDFPAPLLQRVAFFALFAFSIEVNQEVMSVIEERDANAIRVEK
jgi:hypothetical protein